MIKYDYEVVLKCTHLGRNEGGWCTDWRVQLRFCKCSRTLIKVLYCFYPYYNIAHGTFAPPFKLLLRDTV